MFWEKLYFDTILKSCTKCVLHRIVALDSYFLSQLFTVSCY